MLFNSYEYILAFLPISFLVYFWLNSLKLVIASKAWLVTCSLFFYSWWNISYLPLILASMLFNYSIGTSLGNRKHSDETNLKNASRFPQSRKKIPRKLILISGIVFNLGLLGYFKYADFFIANLNKLGTDFQLPNIVLPLAISFFTFQQIAYLVDSFRNETREYDFLNYSLFVTFFPQLIAGPIVHHKEMMPQFASRLNLIKRHRNIALGIFIFSMGLFKKVVVADTFAQWVTPGFDSASTLNLIEAWATSLSYTFQLYFDFSGYVDMAIGSALLFNIKLPINFNSPYKALNIQDFWRRWHMTLSRFLRDYLYIPLGGNQKGSGRTYVNLFATFLLGGLWHGASWMFVIWGALHGLALILHRLWSTLGISMPKLLAWLLTFNFINFTWIFFRAQNIDDATKVIKGMFGVSGIVLPNQLSSILGSAERYGITFGSSLSAINASITIIPVFFFALLISTLSKNSMELACSFQPNKKYFLMTLFFSLSIFFVTENQPFLYFDF